MPANSPASNARRTSAVRALATAVLSLAIFVVVFVGFVIAPLVTLPAAGLVYLVVHRIRSRSRREDRKPAAHAPREQARSAGFGAEAAR